MEACSLLNAPVTPNRQLCVHGGLKNLMHVQILNFRCVTNMVGYCRNREGLGSRQTMLL